MPYREHATDTQTIKGYYVSAIGQAIENALKSNTVVDDSGAHKYGESVTMFRFEARVKLYAKSISFDLGFRMNGATIPREQ